MKAVALFELPFCMISCTLTPALNAFDVEADLVERAVKMFDPRLLQHGFYPSS